jgi:hypothetical protein
VGVGGLCCRVAYCLSLSVCISDPCPAFSLLVIGLWLYILVFASQEKKVVIT